MMYEVTKHLKGEGTHTHTRRCSSGIEWGQEGNGMKREVERKCFTPNVILRSREKALPLDGFLKLKRSVYKALPRVPGEGRYILKGII